MADTITYETTDLSEIIEEVSKHYVIRTVGFQYVGLDRGKLDREGLGKLSFDLSGRITSSSTLETLRKLFLEDDSEYKRFYYPYSTRFWKVHCTSFDSGERGGEVNIFPARIRLETLDQFQYGTSNTVTDTISTANAGTVTFNLVNDGNIWLKPDFQILSIGTTIYPAIQDIQTGEYLRKITWQGTISPGETLYMYPDYTARIAGVWYSNLLTGTYPKLTATNGGTETWTYSEHANSDHSGTVSVLYRCRWW